jgi:hypothetical protein
MATNARELLPATPSFLSNQAHRKVVHYAHAPRKV